MGPDRETTIERLRGNMRSRLIASQSISGIFIYDAKGDWIVTSKTNVPRGMNNSDRHISVITRKMPIEVCSSASPYSASRMGLGCHSIAPN